MAPNDPRRPDPRRDACEELAELLSGDEGQRTARLLQLTEILLPPSASPKIEGDESKEPGAGRPISIWQPRCTDDGCIFERPAPLPLGDHHSPRRRFRQRKAPETTRICLFGESVAAGYLYAPRLTPAAVLAAHLAHFAPHAGFEVIDLARTNERLHPLVETAESSLQLAPDHWVIFAGNNWNLLETTEVSPYFPSIPARQRYAQALRKNDLEGPLELAAQRLEQRVRRTLQRLAHLADGAGVRVTLVIPESHLAGWEVAQPTPWLPSDLTARWHTLAAEAAEHLQAECPSEAAKVARQLLALDGGRCATGHRLLARALLALGELDGARQAAQDAVDRSAYATLGFLGSPQATSTVQGLLRSAAVEHRFRTVDLPWLFAAYHEEQHDEEQHEEEQHEEEQHDEEQHNEEQHEQLPGDALFLDYCHLTAEGMRQSMAAVTAEVLQADGHILDLERVLADAPPPVVSPAASATAHLGAAIHGAHRRIPVLAGDTEPLRFHLRRALTLDPSITAAFLDLAHARAAPGPEVLTAAQGRNLASHHRLLLQHGWRWDHLDIELLRALCDVLEEKGEPARDKIHRILLRHHSVEHRPRDLSRPPYLWQPLERLFPEVMDTDASRRATYRAAWPCSRFCLIADGERDVFLEPVLRLPPIPGVHGDRTGEATVRINGQSVATLPLESSWHRSLLRLPARHLEPAINRVTLAWPPLPAAGDAAFSEVVRQLEMGREADLHPIFGEVSSLVARNRTP